MVNMGEAFAYDVITNQKCELAPLTEREKKRCLLQEEDLLFVRQSLKYEGAGHCVYVGPSDGPRTWESHLIRARLNKSLTVPRFYYYYFRSPSGRRNMETIIHQVAAAGIRGSDLGGLMVPLPSLEWQRAIVGVLGALDGKIEVNRRIAATARDLGISLYSQSLHDGESIEVAVEGLTTALTRGVAPKYTDSPDGLTVVNQRCIRNGRVNLEPSRLTLRAKVRAPKLLHPNDVLVNSTGVGTLGRVARWTSTRCATVDSHITIVRFSEEKVDPVCAGFSMLRAQPEIEAMGEGSTGQTELRRSQIGELKLTLPSTAAQKELRPRLDALEERSDQAIDECLALVALRDTLLPHLMSGKLCVRDAEKIVEDAV
ncbi:restriction endonuclease subunit S [Streptomyces sp. NPDC002486]